MVVIEVLVVIDHLEQKIYVCWISAKVEAVYAESDSVGRGGVTVISYLWKWVGIYSEGVVSIDAGDDVTRCDGIVKKIKGILNEPDGRPDNNSDLRTICACRLPH